MKKEVLYTIQAETFLRALPNEAKGKARRLFALLAENGALSAPFAEKVEGHKGLFEIRFKDSAGQYRVFYAYAAGDIVWALSGFAKKTQKTPPAEIRKALNIKKELGL